MHFARLTPAEIAELDRLLDRDDQGKPLTEEEHHRADVLWARAEGKTLDRGDPEERQEPGVPGPAGGNHFSGWGAWGAVHLPLAEGSTREPTRPPTTKRRAVEQLLQDPANAGVTGLELARRAGVSKSLAYRERDKRRRRPASKQRGAR